MLCQTITADGEDEAEQLRNRLDAHQAVGLPAIRFLGEVVRTILADGRITEDERRELHVAIERVLPPEERQ